MNVNQLASLLREDYLNDNAAAGIAGYESLPTKPQRYRKYEDVSEINLEDEEI